MIYTKIEPLNVVYGINDQEYDDEGRIITLEFDRFYYIACYVPNSGDGLKRLEFRLELEQKITGVRLTLSDGTLYDNNKYIDENLV